MEWIVQATGHRHVRATHETTLELTTEGWLTPAGDCIIGVAASDGCAGLPAPMRSAARSAGAQIFLELDAPTVAPVIVAGRGDPALQWTDPVSMVVRTSEHIDDRTLMLEADHAAADLPRELIEVLATGAPLTATVRVRE
jgi:hypothetical protein